MMSMKIQGTSLTFAALLSLSCLTLGASLSTQFLMYQPGEPPVVPEGKQEEKDEDGFLHLPFEVTPPRWSGVSNVNFGLTLLLATVWVLALGSTPVLVYYGGGKKITKSAITLSCLMWLALFGGLFLFTQIILFNSPHFDQVRSLTIIECTYFMTQVITTVGYGDITPAMPRGQVFVGLYVCLSFFVIALLMSEMQAVVMEKVAKYKDSLMTQSARESQEADSSPSRAMAFKPAKPPAEPLITALAIFAGVALVWACFFHFYPGEGKTWMEAVYMSLVTLTTVGFGAITPVTEAGMLFGAFFMFIGTTALVNVVQNFSTYMLEMDQYEAWDPKAFQKDLKKFRASSSGHAFTEMEFISFALLQKNIATQEQLDSIKESYQAMSSKGAVSTGSILSFHSKHLGEDDIADSDMAPDSTRSEPSAI